MNERAQQLFAEQLHQNRVRCDRVMAALMLVQWGFAIAVALASSPYSWEGTRASIHIHVYFAVFVGGALSAAPVLMTTLRPGAVLTRHLVAASQVLWSALLIHLTGGRIETHFHVFGSLAFLAFYRDWKVLLTATIFVAADHLVRGLVYPESVYGIANPEWWRFLEHAGWVAFEDVVLVVSIFEAMHQTQAMAMARAELEEVNRSIEKKVEERTLELQQAQKLSAIGSLAAGVAHELNTPIQYVNDNTVFLTRSFTELLQVCPASPSTDYLRDEVPRALEESLDGLRRVSTIVRAMKDFSHPSNGKKEPVCLKAALQTTAAVARNEWKNAADLDIEIGADVPDVPALRDELNQVFLNMIVNAAHAIEEKNSGRGKITIDAGVAGDQVEINISDDGAGIADEVKGRIFQPFFTTKPVGKGTGQGLAIAWAVVVEKHGGSLAVRSERGRGSTFTIRLPLAA